MVDLDSYFEWKHMQELHMARCKEGGCGKLFTSRSGKMTARMLQHVVTCHPQLNLFGADDGKSASKSK